MDLLAELTKDDDVEHAVALRDIVITEVSAVGIGGNGPANEIEGWLVQKSARGVEFGVPMTPAGIIWDNIARVAKQTPALAAPPTAVKRGDTLQVFKHETGTWAVTTDNCPEVKIYPRGGEPFNVSKADIEAAETQAIHPQLSFAPVEEIARKVQDVVERARVYNRDPKTGKFMGRFFQRAQSRPKLAGTRFFT